MRNKLLTSIIAVVTAASLGLSGCAFLPGGGTDWQTTIRGASKVAILVVLELQPPAQAVLYAKAALPVAQTVAALAAGDTAPTIAVLQDELDQYLHGPGSNVITAAAATAVIQGYGWITEHIGDDAKTVLAYLGAASEGIADACAMYVQVPAGLQNQAVTTAQPKPLPATMHRPATFGHR